MKCSRRSVTNLADLTIGLPGSLNVRVLCSMYRTSHINEESRLCKRDESTSWKKKPVSNRLHFQQYILKDEKKPHILLPVHYSVHSLTLN